MPSFPQCFVVVCDASIPSLLIYFVIDDTRVINDKLDFLGTMLLLTVLHMFPETTFLCGLYLGVDCWVTGYVYLQLCRVLHTLSQIYRYTSHAYKPCMKSFILTNLVDVKWSFIVVFICSSLTSSDLEGLLAYLMAFWLASL